MKKNITRGVVAAAGLTGAVAMGLTSLAAGGATAGPLPGGTVTRTLVDGTPVTVQLFDEFVNVQRAVTNVQTSREVWLSGKIKVTVGGKAEGGSVNAGYLVGCQVNFGASAEGGAGISQGFAEGSQPAPSAEAGAGFSLGPGQASYFPIIETTSGTDTAYSDYKVNSYSFKGKSGGVVYSQEKFGMDGCAGYASAKAKIKVTVSTDAVKGVITLYGKPFSIG
ncbi:MspA family porin [Gordonia alkanivorans]|uniref:MspA family porin n=1 Tax=Gordonia alkanivorans TaxID=84096 RepID=UPI00244A9409|nr:MspA family porin [Gordonia alkanivorans]MDH3014573.1 MspA family porin [Gordonia alkanivorans]MDH3039807.1 MspA family porin [Gordonia alkanivorans]